MDLLFPELPPPADDESAMAAAGPASAEDDCSADPAQGDPLSLPSPSRLELQQERGLVLERESGLEQEQEQEDDPDWMPAEEAAVDSPESPPAAAADGRRSERQGDSSRPFVCTASGCQLK